MSGNTHKAILFLGATGGSGLSALRRSLAAGHTCIALCRTPSRLLEKLEAVNQPANLLTEQGNALDVDAVARCLTHPSEPSRLVDAIVFSIGGAFSFSKWGNDDPTVCANSMATLLKALAQTRANGTVGRPRIAAVSTTGISEHGRDIPAALIPMYHVMLKEPHKDKKAMEDQLLASGEEYTIIRPSLLTDGPEETKRPIRAGMEDPQAKKLVSRVLGYTISREDVGKWIYENALEDREGKWANKIASLTY
ncbi:NAD(P)-binding protein [Pleurostoma richardsiae]|uniref:NAD(P)-binding protein n=1 Tax=Pleurostoma richardsiae TaxID=41990 RepID=A0AA38VLY4_9PEZI|nr:NAD(P)-binding protein [Pleurostoma richardsiae]